MFRLSHVSISWWKEVQSCSLNELKQRRSATKEYCPRHETAAWNNLSSNWEQEQDTLPWQLRIYLTDQLGFYISPNSQEQEKKIKPKVTLALSALRWSNCLKIILFLWSVSVKNLIKVELWTCWLIVASLLPFISSLPAPIFPPPQRVLFQLQHGCSLQEWTFPPVDDDGLQPTAWRWEIQPTGAGKLLWSPLAGEIVSFHWSLSWDSAALHIRATQTEVTSKSCHLQLPLGNLAEPWALSWISLPKEEIPAPTHTDLKM